MGIKAINETGKKYGRLTVIERIYPNQGSFAMWLCRCNCGKETIVYGRNLRNGNTKSCGCLQKEITRDRSRLKLGLANMRILIGNYKRNAKKRGLGYSLTEEQFFEITQKDCYYCGAKPSNIANHKTQYGSYIYNGLDRIDNTKGYTLDNVVPCCISCNMAKNTKTLREFKDWIKKVYSNLKEK